MGIKYLNKANIPNKFNKFFVKLLVLIVRLALLIKGWLKKAFPAIGAAIFWLFRHLFLPLLVRIYRFVGRMRRALRPAERRFVLVATHRGILHGALIAVALTTAGGNLYAQTQATVSSGEQSVLYKYITGDTGAVDVSGPPTLSENKYVDGVVDVNNNNTNTTLSVTNENDPEYIEWLDSFEQGSEAMTELGALLPEIIPGAPAPIHRTQTETYVVADGDTISGIANKFGISIATILWENNLTARDFIKPGQSLIILPSSGITYTVKAGDTINKIAATYKVEVDEIKSWNNIIDDAAVQKGKNIFIPGGKVIPPPVAVVVPKPKPVTTSTKPVAKPADASDNSKTNMIWPAATHYISQPYGIWSRVSGGTHSGVDLAAAVGTAIYAADDGIVTHAGCGASCKKSYGLYIDIDHGNSIATRYGHASKLLVKVGDQVRRGQVIALMGSTGLSTGPHLHFEVRKNGRYVNPMPYIR